MAATATNGILLYPSSLYPFPTTSSSNSVASSSSSGASSSSRHPNNNANANASTPPTPQRKIRFAPLPDPRRSFVDDGDEFPMSDGVTISCPPMLAERDAIPSISSLAIDSLSSEIDTESDSTSRSSSRASKGADSSATTPTASASDSVSSFTQDSPSYQTKIALPPIPNPLLAAKLKQFEDNSSSHTSWAKPKSLFRPFLRRPHSSSGATPTLSSSSHSANLPSASSSTSTLHPHPKHAPFPRINLSSPSLGLFRVSSRHRHDDDDYSDDGKSKGFMKLAKWTSSSSSVNKQHSHNHFHNTGSPLSPLTRTQSRGSVQSVQTNSNQTPFGSTASLPLTRVDSSRINNYVRPASSLPGRRPSTASGAISAPTSPARKGKGTRMLNGRVYGHRRNSSNPNGNPFANARDEADPEFVEWGYGGMGSVRNGSGVGHGVWGRLQSEGTALGGGGKTDDEELDDGSGMGWVRKRREQKEKKEREEKERLAKEAQAKLEAITEAGDAKAEEAEAEVDEKEKEFVRSDEIEQVKDRPDTAATITLSSVASPTLSSALSTPTIRNDVDTPKPSDDQDEHDTRVVNVSAHSPSLARRHSHGRSRSRDSIPLLEKAQAEDTTQTVISVDVKEDETDESEEEEDEGTRPNEDDEDSEEDSENVEDAEKRKLALGAGVEKISRHK